MRFCVVLLTRKNRSEFRHARRVSLFLISSIQVNEMDNAHLIRDGCKAKLLKATLFWTLTIMHQSFSSSRCGIASFMASLALSLLPSCSIWSVRRLRRLFNHSFPKSSQMTPMLGYLASLISYFMITPSKFRISWRCIYRFGELWISSYRHVFCAEKLGLIRSAWCWYYSSSFTNFIAYLTPIRPFWWCLLGLISLCFGSFGENIES